MIHPGSHMPGFFFILCERYPRFVHIQHKEISRENRIFAIGVLKILTSTGSYSDNIVLDIQRGQSGTGSEINSRIEYAAGQFLP